MSIEDDPRYESFITSFCDAGASRFDCNCGKTYYNPEGLDIYYSDDEIGQLEARTDSYDVDHDISVIEFEGRQYAEDCNCWHDRCKQAMNFLDGHKVQIAKYLNSEKKRLIEEANIVPDL